jgi:hypothetical protein
MGTTNDNDRTGGESTRQAVPSGPRLQTCDLYSPGHQMHYRHQGQAVRSPSRVVTNAFVDDTTVVLLLDDGQELRWRHHDPDRLRRMLEALPGKRVIYPEHHALRVGPYWFNCAPEDEDWQDCSGAPA